MELQLIKIFISVITLSLLMSCSNKQNIEGDWSAIDSNKNYSELYFKDGKIRIYTEIAGYIGMQNFVESEDSLFTDNLNYKKGWINPDSVILFSKYSTLYLKRVDSGFKLSEYNNESLEDSFLTAFHTRMYEIKVFKQSYKNMTDSIPKVEEETIEIKRN